ncbi:DegT/DnrJ/EryC1/StrS family aminotransferase [Pseudodesulfovibrio methanolicus]|uniref:DegT/DnrJ/EryC1/StrS family aminotransferase n=1 Tax=Pseudodesulfovibrio methanolicus TaxID=3126690 RepID=A0ABZ2ITW6_9BACT
MSSKFIKVATPQVGEEEIQAVVEAIKSGRYASGPRVEAFEEAFSKYVGTSYGVGVSTGTAALHIALEAFGIGKGDEVIVPPLTFFATVSAVLYLGAIPVFADIDEDNLCLSAESCRKVVTDKTKAIIPVHFAGAAARMDPIMELASEKGLIVIEDCAQAHGTMYNGRVVGSIGHAGAFSLFATKHITTGEGGIITTNDEEIAKICKMLRSHGMSDRDTHVRLAYNNRLNEIGAAMGLVQLTKLDDLNARRIANSEYILDEARKLPWANVPVAEGDMVHTYFWCPIMVKPDSGRTVEELKAHLDASGIGYRHRYVNPLYKQPVLKTLGLDYSDVFLPNAEKTVGQVLGLPNHPSLPEEDRERVVEVLKAF